MLSFNPENRKRDCNRVNYKGFKEVKFFGKCGENFNSLKCIHVSAEILLFSTNLYVAVNKCKFHCST